MTESAGVEPSGTEDVLALPPEDIRLTVADKNALLEAISAIFSTESRISDFLTRIGYPARMTPAMVGRASYDIWAAIFNELDNGVIAAPYRQLLGAAVRVYSNNQALRPLALRYGLIEEQPSASPASPADQIGTDTYHVIFRAAGEEEREQSRELLEGLGFKPREVWSTALAVSYELQSGRRDPRLLLENSETNLGWTVVPPGTQNYVLRYLFVEGPDGRSFRLTDTPAQTTVGTLAAEVIEQYPSEMIPSARAIIVDRMEPSGQRERLTPEESLNDAGVEEGDRLRVGYQALAGGGSVFTETMRSYDDHLESTLHELMVKQQRARLKRERVRLERERLRLRREGLKLKQEELILQETSRRVSTTTPGPHFSQADMFRAEDVPPADSMQVAIYADVDEGTEEWRRLANATRVVAEALGYEIEGQLPTEYGSVFHRAFWKRIATSEEARQYEALLQQALGLKVAMLDQAEVDHKQAAAAADLIAALAAVPTACVKVGSLLLVKYAVAPHGDPVVLVRSLSPREVQAIDRYPAIMKNPHTALDALSMAITAAEQSETTANEPRPE